VDGVVTALRQELFYFWYRKHDYPLISVTSKPLDSSMSSTASGKAKTPS
jgi:hypothetical protein